MSELRYDPLQNRWTIIATERQQRPRDFVTRREVRRDKDDCPFCPGFEDRTPPEIAAIRDEEGTLAPDTDPGSEPSNWRVRVVPNRFPALSPEAGEVEWSRRGIYECINGVGAHEVIIEGPDHDLSMAEFPLDLTLDIFRMYRERLTALMQDRRLKYALIFKNHGATAGASLAHPHSQIIATPVTPRTVQIELVASLKHFRDTKKCLACDLIKQEEAEGKRIIYDDTKIIAFNSYASRFPFELFIAPKSHSAFFERTTDEELESLARCMRDVLGRLKRALDDPPFNYILHTAPNVSADPIPPGYWRSLGNDYHWHIEVIPRLVRTAGFEWGSGLHINPMPPERAAEILRGDDE